MDDQQTRLDTEQSRLQAQAHLEKREWSQAKDLFQQILLQSSSNNEALIGLATALDQLGQFEELYTASQQILERAPDSALGFAYKARALQKLERISEATIANDQALLLDMNLGLAWVNRSGLQILQQKLPDALRSSYRAIELSPHDARAWANRSVIFLNIHRLAEALEDIEQSLALDPQNLFSLQIKGEILGQLGRMHDVIAVTQTALSIDAGYVPSIIQAIQAFRALEIYDKLKERAQTLTGLLPDNLFAWENYMRSLRGLGEFEDANQALDRVIELDPSNVRFWTMKADTLYRLERYREAARIAEQAIKISHDYRPAHRIREKSIRLMYQKKERKRTPQPHK